MTTEFRRPLPVIKSFEDAVSLCDKERDTFHVDAFRLRAWLGQLLVQSITAEYAGQGAGRRPIMQFGQAQRAFLQVFGYTTDAEFDGLLHNLYRFTEYDDPLASILFQALVPLSVEHECAGDYSRGRAPDLSRRPREAAALMRQSVERWCDWVDAVIHLQTHALWHVAPECFAPGRKGRDWSELGIRHWFSTQMSDPGKAKWAGYPPAAIQRFKDGSSRPIVGEPIPSQPQRTWPHPDLDEAVISLWPLLQRHNWTIGDLLNVLRDLLPHTDIYPCQTERNLATYCAHTLRLQKMGHGKTARESRPAGYELALRLCLPRTPSLPRPNRFGPGMEEPPALAPVPSETSPPHQLVFDGDFAI